MERRKLQQQDIRTVIIKQEKEKDSGAKEHQTDIGTVPFKHEDRTTEKMLRDKGRTDIGNGPENEILANHWMSLSRGDFRTLQGRRYLNDKIIDSYIRLIQERSEANTDLPTVYGLTTFFYTQLSTFGLEEGRKRTQGWIKSDLREKDLIFCPVHKQDHWTLIVVEVSTKSVHYLDSIVGSREKSPAPGLIKRYMEAYYRQLGEVVHFKIRIRKDAPIQQNGVDCGVFVCQNAERMSRKGALNFTQEDMPLARKRMTEELLNGKLDPGLGKGRCGQQKKAGSKKKTKTGNTGSRVKGKSCGLKQETMTASHRCGDKEGATDKGSRKEKVEWPRKNSLAWEE